MEVVENNMAEDWTVNDKYVAQAKEVYDRQEMRLEEGILQKLTLDRQKLLDSHIAKNCYQNKNYNYLQAKQCENFHRSNDFKLNMLKTFYKDHALKEWLSYEDCY